MATLLPLMFFLLLAVIVLGTVAGICVRKYAPARFAQFSSFNFGFLCGVLTLLPVSLAAPWFAMVTAPFMAAVVGRMDTLMLVAAAAGGLCIAIGAFTLVAAQLRPELLEPAFLRWLTVGRLEPSRRNRTMVGIWAILMGTYLVLAAMDHIRLGLAVALLSLPFIVAAQKKAGP